MSLKDTINSKLVDALKTRVGKTKTRTMTKARNSSENIDMEVLEGFMPITRDFSDDFNNDFER
jgi:hypothetical protein